MSYPGQGSNEPYGEEESYDQDDAYQEDYYVYESQPAEEYAGYEDASYTQTAVDSQPAEGYEGYEYPSYTQTAAPSSYYSTTSYDTQTQQTDQGLAHYSTAETQPYYSQDTSAWQQSPYGSQAGYGDDQAASSAYGSQAEGYGYDQVVFSADTSLQRPSTPVARGSSYGLQSTVQHMIPDSRWTRYNAPTAGYGSANSGVFTTGSAGPGTDAAPRQTFHWEEDEYFGRFDEEEAEEDENDYERSRPNWPNYSAAVEPQNLPAVAPDDWEQEDRFEAATRLGQSEESIDEQAKKIANKKYSAVQSTNKYRDNKSWEDIYTIEKEKLVKKINELVKEEVKKVKKERDSLLKQLKRHRPDACKCDKIHQYLYFTGQNREITREEAYQRGWLTADELAALQCRSPEHSPGKASNSSGKSNSGSGSGSNQDGSPTGKGKGSGNDSSGRGSGRGRDDYGKGQKRDRRRKY